MDCRCMEASLLSGQRCTCRAERTSDSTACTACALTSCTCTYTQHSPRLQQAASAMAHTQRQTPATTLILGSRKMHGQSARSH